MRSGAILFFLLYFITVNAQVNIIQPKYSNSKTLSENISPTVSLLYKDTLLLPSFKDFDLPVIMKTGNKISAISLGFYYPEDYLEITGIILADSIHGFYYSDTNGLLIVAWSDINPINIPVNEPVITLGMKSLDLTGLIGTIKLGIYESSEFADSSANIIEGVELEVSEIAYRIPDPIDTISGNYVEVYPNPFDDYAVINFYLKTDGKVRISMCDLSGMEVYQAEETEYPKGVHQVKLHGKDLSKGMYLLKFEISNSEGSGMKVIKVVSIR
jgi:hypothetical protein